MWPSGSFLVGLVMMAVSGSVVNAMCKPKAPTEEELLAKRTEYMKKVGLDPNARYPFWPLVASEPTLEMPDTEDWPEGKVKGGFEFGPPPRSLVGEVTNHGELEYEYLSVTITLFNKGEKVDEGIEGINGLMPGKTWRYKMVLWDYNGAFDSYKMKLSGSPSTPK
jgi:hypothetical protein